MKTSKLLYAGLAGFVAYFLLGWLLYGVLTMSYFEGQTPEVARDVSRGDSMVWWSLLLGNLIIGFFLAFVFLRWANIKTFAGGLIGGAIIGAFIVAGIDFTMHGTMDIMSLPAVFVDVVVGTIMWALTGGVVGWVLGMGKE
jgi:hypothetical protein